LFLARLTAAEDICRAAAVLDVDQRQQTSFEDDRARNKI
jgi:hypothetical protein